MGLLSVKVIVYSSLLTISVIVVGQQNNDLTSVWLCFLAVISIDKEEILNVCILC